MNTNGVSNGIERNENNNLMKSLINRLGGNVGHTYKTIIEELFHNSMDSIHRVTDLNILVIKKPGEIILCDNNMGCKNIDSFLHSTTKKVHQIGRKNSGLKDAFLYITDGYGELEIFSRYNDNETNVDHYINLNMTNCTTKYNNEKSKYSEAANIEILDFSDHFSENYIKTTYNYNKSSTQNKRCKKEIDDYYNDLINNNIQYQSFIENIRANSGTIIRIKIDEHQTEKIYDFNKNINEKLFIQIAHTVFNISFTLNLVINEKQCDPMSIGQNLAIKTYLGTDNYNTYPINKDCELYYSILSEEEAKKQLDIYGEGDKKYSIQSLRHGAVSIDEVVLSTHADILCGPGLKPAQNIPNLRVILKIKTNSSYIDSITMSKKTDVNIANLPRTIKDKLSEFRKMLKANGLFQYQDKIIELAPNSLKNCDIQNVINDINAATENKIQDGDEESDGETEEETEEVTEEVTDEETEEVTEEETEEDTEHRSRATMVAPTAGTQEVVIESIRQEKVGECINDSENTVIERNFYSRGPRIDTSLNLRNVLKLLDNIIREKEKFARFKEYWKSILIALRDHFSSKYNSINEYEMYNFNTSDFIKIIEDLKWFYNDNYTAEDINVKCGAEISRLYDSIASQHRRIVLR